MFVCKIDGACFQSNICTPMGNWPCILRKDSTVMRINWSCIILGANSAKQDTTISTLSEPISECLRTCNAQFVNKISPNSSTSTTKTTHKLKDTSRKAISSVKLVHAWAINCRMSSSHNKFCKNIRIKYIVKVVTKTIISKCIICCCLVSLNSRICNGIKLAEILRRNLPSLRNPTN